MQFFQHSLRNKILISLKFQILQPIKYSNDDDKYYQTPRGYGYNGHNNGHPDDPRNNLNPYNDGFHEQFRVENENLQKYLNEVDQKSSHECSLNVAAQWIFENNVNEVTQLEAVSKRAKESLTTKVNLIPHSVI